MHGDSRKADRHLSGIPVVTVIWSYTGQSTPEIEQRVTTYSELR